MCQHIVYPEERPSLVFSLRLLAILELLSETNVKVAYTVLINNLLRFYEHIKSSSGEGLSLTPHIQFSNMPGRD